MCDAVEVTVRNRGVHVHRDARGVALDLAHTHVLGSQSALSVSWGVTQKHTDRVWLWADGPFDSNRCPFGAGNVRGEAWAAVSPTGVGTYLDV